MGVDGISNADIFDEYFDDEKPKYIIKNCPCYMKQPEADCWADQLSWCQNIIDCPLKRIVELCKGKYYESSSTVLRVFANEILQLLDIQEVLQ